MSIEPLYPCPHCREKSFVVSASSSVIMVGACLKCQQTGTLAIFPAGVMNPGDEAAQELGFFPELFNGYLWVDNEERRILVSFIASKFPRKGNFKKLCRSIEAHGYRVAVPSPFPLMVHILKKMGYEPHPEFNDLAGEDVDVWEKPSP